VTRTPRRHQTSVPSRVLVRALRVITFSLVPVVLLSACANQTARPRSTGGSEAMEMTARSAEIESRADAIEEAISGDALEREAAHYLQFEQYNRPFHECMAAKGVKVPSGFLPGWTGYRANSTSGIWMGALGRKPSTAALATAESRRAGEVAEFGGFGSQSVVFTDAYQTAASACEKAAAGGVVDLGHLAGVPEGYYELEPEFNKLISSVDEQLGSIRPYVDCMREAGFDLPYEIDGAQGSQAFYLWLRQQMPLPPLPGEEPKPEWSAYLDLEAAALDADAACRSAKYQEGLALLAPMLDDFETAHADEIARVDAGWQATVQQAREEGFDPSDT
jgi:hypothetical protein